MAGIIVRKGSQTLLQTAIEAGEYIIGRDRTCDFCLEDEEVSHKHAKIMLSEKGVEIADLASLNGTFKNGKKITKASLAPGDIINVSGYSIILAYDLQPETLDKRNNSHHEKDKPTIGSLTDNNAKSPKVTRVHDGFIIGRSPQSDMYLANENISWTHATFRMENNRPAIMDNDTTNGTKVNGKLLTSIKDLSNGDVISIGEHSWIFNSDLLKNRKRESKGNLHILLLKPIYRIAIGILFILLLLSLLFPGKNRQSIDALLVSANHYEQNGQFSQALSVLKKILESTPDDQEVISKINVLNKKIEILNEIRHIESLLTIHDTFSLLKADEELNNLEKRFNDHDISSITKPIHERIKNQKLANEYFELLTNGNYQELIDRLSESQHPQKITFLLNARKGLARQLELSGLYQPAEQEWQKVLEIENDEEAKQALARIRITALVSQPVQKGSKKSVNTPPVVTEIFTKKYEITVDELVVLSINTKDAENDLLTYEWTASKGTIHADGNKASYRADLQKYSDREQAEITVQVSDANNPPITRKAHLIILSPQQSLMTTNQIPLSDNSDEEISLSATQEEALKLYWIAYRKMQYKNTTAYKEVLAMFEKVLKMTPDENSEIYIKTKQKIEQINKELAGSYRDSASVNCDMKF